MSKQTQAAVENYLMNRVPNLKRLNFSWFGGEPLLAKDVVLRLAEFAYNLCKQNQVEFKGGFTTNAYLLTQELATKLISLQQNFFQITLDGLREEHDRLRKRINGKGTFDVIWKNLLALKEIPAYFDCMLRLHVRRDNIDNLELLVQEIASAFGRDRRFRMDFQHLRNMGGEGGKTVIRPLTIPELQKTENHLRQIWFDTINGKEPVKLGSFRLAANDEPASDKNPPKPALGESAGSRRIEDIVENEPYICYAARPNSMIIRANGRIGKCTVALDDQRNDLGFLAPDGTVVINNQKILPWLRGLETLDDREAGCPLGGLPDSNLPSPMPSKIVPIKFHKTDQMQ